MSCAEVIRELARLSLGARGAVEAEIDIRRRELLVVARWRVLDADHPMRGVVVPPLVTLTDEQRFPLEDLEQVDDPRGFALELVQRLWDRHQRHEFQEWLRRDGRRVKEPHPEEPGRA